MATTTNYGWSTPDNTAYVKDGAQAIRTLGSSIDTTLASFLNIKQIVGVTANTPVTCSSNVTFTDTGLTASITPSSVNSKILVLFAQAGTGKSNGNANNGVRLELLRGATLISIPSVTGMFTGSALTNEGCISSVFIDSPATTAATTYKTRILNNVNAASIYAQANNATSNMYLVELEY